MENSIVFSKVVNFELSKQELIDFVLNIKNIIFNKENGFTKYYNRQVFEVLYSKYKNKEIDADYVSYWSHAYTFIIMAYTWKESAKRDLYPIEVIMYKISDYLDELYFTTEIDFSEFEKVINNVFVADKIYNDLLQKNIEKIFYNYNYNEDIINITYINKNKEFASFEFLVEGDKVLEVEEMDEDAYKTFVNNLLNEGYTDLFEKNNL